MAKETAQSKIVTQSFSNRPPLRIDKGKTLTLEYWRGGRYGCEGGSLMAHPASGGGYHVWRNTWSNVDPCWDHDTYGGIVRGYDDAEDLLLSLTDGDHERMAEALDTLRRIGCVELEEA